MSIQQLLFNEIQKNPEMVKMLTELKESGKTPQEFFYQKAEEKGIDPNEIVKTLQGLIK